MDQGRRMRKIIIYVAGIVVSLFIPFLFVLLFAGSIPDRYILSPKFFFPEKNRINVDALKSDQRFANVERLAAEGKGDHVLFTVGRDILRVVLIPPGEGSKTLDNVDENVRIMQEKKGAKLAGSKSVTMGGESYRKTLFDDGTVSFAQAMSGAVLQVITRDQGEVESYFRKIGLVVENPNVTERERWLSANKLTLLIPILLGYSFFWVMGILKGGTWVAAVHPVEGAKKIPAEELKNRLLQVNQLDVAFKIEEKSRDMLAAEWRLDGNWQGLIEKEKIEYAVALDMRLHEDRGAVSVIERKKKIVREGGVLGWKAQFEFFRGITFKSYEAGATYGLSFVDGQFKLTGYSYSFNVQAMKNPLIDLITRSGWKWEPRIFFL